MTLILRPRSAANTRDDLPLSFLELKYPLDSEGTALIDRVHYHQAGHAAKMIGCFLPNSVLKDLAPEIIKGSSNDETLVGALTLNGGIAYAKPKGRKYLAAKHFPSLNLDRMDRGEIVEKMKLCRISRIAIEPDLQRHGIGRRLVLESRRRAGELMPDTLFIEVMTSQRLADAQKLLKEAGKKKDFLQLAGFRLAPIFTRIQKEKRTQGRDRRLYYWAPVLK